MYTGAAYVDIIRYLIFEKCQQAVMKDFGGLRWTQRRNCGDVSAIY